MVIGTDEIQFFGNGVLGPRPYDMQRLIAKTVHAEGGIVDTRVVERVTALAKKASRDIVKAVCGCAEAAAAFVGMVSAVAASAITVGLGSSEGGPVNSPIAETKSVEFA
jgi:hypothetical protein